MPPLLRAGLIVLAVSLAVAVAVGAGALAVLELAVRPAVETPWTVDAVPRDQLRRVFGVPPPRPERRVLTRQFTVGGRLMLALIELGDDAQTAAALREAGLRALEAGELPDTSTAEEALRELGLTVEDVTALDGLESDTFARVGALVRTDGGAWLFVEAAESGQSGPDTP